MASRPLIWSLAGVVLTLAGPATAARGPRPPADHRPGPEPPPWILRYAPTRHTVELGLAFGPLFPPDGHGLVDGRINADSGGTFFQRYANAVNAFDLRLAYFPLAALGLEIEGGIAPTYTVEYKERANLYGFRGHLIAQLPRWSATPYLFAGGGLLGTAGALGSDVDPAVHFGVGGKVFANDRAVLRIDVRDALTRGVERPLVHYVQLSFGVSLALRPGSRTRR